MSDSFRAKRHYVPEAFDVAFELATELENQEPPADTGWSAELVSFKGFLATSQNIAMEAKEQIAPLQENHNSLDNNVLEGYGQTQATWKEGKKALLKQAGKAEDHFDSIRFKKAKIKENLLGGRGIHCSFIRGWCCYSQDIKGL